MTSAVYDLTIDAGGDFDLNLLWKDDTNTPIDLTSYSATMIIKPTYASSKSIDCSEYVTLGGDEGTIDINIPASITSTFGFALGVYDVQLNSVLGAVYKLIRGKVIVNKEVVE